MSSRRPHQKSLPPLDAAGLERLALRYVERFATSRAKLAAYLMRKVRERGWEGPAVDAAAIADRLAGLGYVDDRGYAEAKAAALGRRGLGARRVADAWRAAGIGDSDRDALAGEVEARGVTAALAFARRRRLGPWGAPVDRAGRDKQLAAMLRAGHSSGLARRILTWDGEVPPEPGDLE